jgi:hypothetical protein
MPPARRPVLRDEDELHVASFAKKAAAFLRISRSVTTNGNLLCVNNPIRWRTISF